MADAEGDAFNHALLRERMAALGKTTTDIGAACGVGERAARKWRDGKTVPKFAQAMRLARVLGVNPAELLAPPTPQGARGS